MPGAGRSPPGDLPALIVHRSSVLAAHHLTVGSPPRTGMPRSVLDAASWAGSDTEARVIVAAACQQRLVRPGDLRSISADLTRARRRGLVLQTAADVEGGTAALSEIDVVGLCRRFGLPVPQAQQRRRDASGRWRYLDAYWPAFGLHVEVDGAHHMDVEHWEADMRRQNEIWIAGDRILRFSAWQVRYRPEAVAVQLRAALEAAGWRGTR